MKLKIFYFLSVLSAICILHYSCNQKLLSVPKEATSSIFYNLYKIDSTKNYYLIYATKGDSLYKIVSKKKEISNCKKVRLNNIYNLSLESIWNKDIIVDGINVSPSILPNVDCMYFDEITKICLEGDSIRDLFKTHDLSGLCLIK